MNAEVDAIMAALPRQREPCHHGEDCACVRACSYSALLAHFGSRLANDRPKGPQPATYGHIQTLADLIDDWSETIYWGDKGVISGLDIRHAGTLHRPLKPPQPGEVWQELLQCEKGCV